MSTIGNLKEAFAGESQASQKYRAFARKAELDGLPNIARLFRAASAAECIHAEGHLKAMEGVGATAANLKAAIEGETYEFTTMYPPMLAEAVHAGLYGRALAALEQGGDLAEAGFYLCPVCGHIEFGAAPERCPICGAGQDKFSAVR